MQNTKLMAAVLGALCAMPSFAADAPAVTSNFGFTSDYVYNGISQSYRAPALQGGFDYAHSSGAYLGVWGSNVSGNQFTNASMETDIYGGYNGTINDALSYQAGLISVMYPGGKAYNSTTDTYKRWDTSSAILGVTLKGVNVKLTYTLTDWYGISNNGFAPTMWVAGDGTTATGVSTADSTVADLGSKGSTYIEVNYSYAIAEGLSLALHAGRQRVANFSRLDYTDYKLAISKLYRGFTYGLAYTTTTATDNTLYRVKLNGDDKVLSGNILAASVSRSF